MMKAPSKIKKNYSPFTTNLKNNGDSTEPMKINSINRLRKWREIQEK